jgi:transcriptional regulator with XRE-family HTH domain
MAAKRTRLARARKAAGYTQERLAQALNVETSTVARWEAGKAEPLPYKRPKLGRLLGIGREELEALLRGDDLAATTVEPSSVAVPPEEPVSRGLLVPVVLNGPHHLAADRRPDARGQRPRLRVSDAGSFGC